MPPREETVSYPPVAAADRNIVLVRFGKSIRLTGKEDGDEEEEQREK